ncbi:hypothetical protein ACH41H_36155 [Streptomyces sp. NPDC020800]|uniref:hypothetical protein n=1 Tax=Streptomyces sp. NPDC020800 TaxID=3365092 RepID=UPI0037ACB5DA
MPEPLSDDYLKQTQKIILGLPHGPWDVVPNDHGLPDQVGPICFLETWSDTERLPVVEFISFAREAVPAYVGEVARQRDQIVRLQRRVDQLEKARGGDREDH